MRQPATVTIPPHLIEQAQLYAPTRDPVDAVCYVLADYPRLVADARKMRSRLVQIDTESADLDARIADLQRVARLVLDL
jgi:hypothetical protein